MLFRARFRPAHASGLDSEQKLENAVGVLYTWLRLRDLAYFMHEVIRLHDSWGWGLMAGGAEQIDGL